MNESIIISEQAREQFTAQACLTALGIKIGREKILEPIHQTVKIAQKVVKYRPTDKLIDGLVAIFCGAHGLVEINKRVRGDPALQAGFGRTGCAEQSVVQDTLDACTETNVQQMRQALTQIYRRFSQGYHHPYEQAWQILDVDVTGRPCGPKAAFATPGYFAHQRYRRGRQEGYVIATRYAEIVTKQLFAGNVQLHGALRPLLEDAQQVLELTVAQRQAVLVREDSGGGSVADVNWVLEHFGHFHGKDCSG